jgi:DNA-binding CsgD family transcriptional regulator
LAERRGEIAPALRGFADAVEVCHRCGDQGLAGFRLEQAAAAAAAAGHAAAAVRLFAAANALHPTTEAGTARLYAGIPYHHAQALRSARAAMGEDAFAARWDAGEALTLDEAIAAVRDLADQLAGGKPAAGPPGVGPESLLRTPLSRREREVLQLMADGLADKAIAVALGISRRTASKHVAAVRAKLAAESRTAAVSYALRQGLLDGSPSESSHTPRIHPA